MMKRLFQAAAFAAVLGCAACGAVTGTQVSAAVTATVAAVADGGLNPIADLTAAVDDYGVAKGIAQEGQVSNPAIAGTVAAAVSTGDAALSRAQTMLTTGVADATQAETLVTTLKAQTLTLAGAPSVTVVPNAPSS
jgi:hypothetical protein